MYAWEIPFQKVVGEKRKEELKEVKTATILRTIFIGFMIFTERSAMFITILTFVLFGNVLSANVVSTNWILFSFYFINKSKIDCTVMSSYLIKATGEILSNYFYFVFLS